MSPLTSECVTIGIPVYNMEKSILNAINSCLAQTYPNIEILVVNDGSTDKTISVIRDNISDKRVRIYERPQNGGVCAAMRDLVEQASGTYICFLDADDTMMPNRVEKQYNAIKSAERRFPNKMVASFCGSLVNDIEKGVQYTVDPKDLWDDEVEHPFGAGTGHSMYRVADILKLGNFDERFSRSSDTALALTFLANGGFYAMVSEPLITYNFRWTNMKKNVENKERQLFEDLKQEIAIDMPQNVYLQRTMPSKYHPISTHISLFGFIPLIKIKRRRNNRKTWIYLFNIIPLFKLKNCRWIQEDK